MAITWLRWLGFGALVVLAVGCAGPGTQVVAPVPVPAPRPTPQAWHLEGRIAVQRGNEGWNAGLRWDQRADAFAISISAPLGRGTARLSGDDDEVVLITPEGDARRASDPEALLEQSLGWTLPVSGARHWVTGAATPDQVVNHRVVDDAGRMTDWDQDGWRISVSRFTAAGSFELPQKIFMSRGDLKVKLVVSRWTVEET